MTRAGPVPTGPSLAQRAVGDSEVVDLIGPAFSGESRTADPIFNETGPPIVTRSATGVDLCRSARNRFEPASSSSRR